MEQAFLSFSAVIIAFLVAFSLFAFGAIDLWAQTLIHASLWLLLLYSLCRRSSDPVFTKRDVQSLVIWLVLLGILGISVLRSGAPDRSQQEWWVWVDYFLIYLLGTRLGLVQRSGLVQTILVVSLLLCAWGWYEFLIDHQLRGGPLLNDNVFAGYLLIPIFLAAKRWENTHSIGSSGILFILTATLLLSRSLGAIISLLVGSAYLGLRLRGYRHFSLALASLSALIVILVAAKAHASWDVDRLAWWQTCIRMALFHPMWGNGPGTFDIALPHRLEMNLFSLYAHSSWLQWLGEIGLLGVLGILAVIFSVLRKQTNPFYSAGLIAVLCHNWVDYSLLIPAQSLLFWLIASFSGATTPPEKPPTTYPIAWKLLLSLVCVSATWHTMNRFQADRHYINAVHFAIQKDWQHVNQEAETSMTLNPLSPKPYALLASVALATSTTPPDRAALQTSLAYILNALDHEPIQPAYWAQALALSYRLSLPQNINFLRDQLNRSYPFLLQDRRIRPYLH